MEIFSLSLSHRPDKVGFQMMQSRELSMNQDPFLSQLPKDIDNIVFNKDHYKAKLEVDRLSVTIRHGSNGQDLFMMFCYSLKTEVSKEMQFILTIPPEARTDDQIKFVRNGLQKLTAFAEYPINMQEKICKCAFYQK